MWLVESLLESKSFVKISRTDFVHIQRKRVQLKPSLVYHRGNAYFKAISLHFMNQQLHSSQKRNALSLHFG